MAFDSNAKSELFGVVLTPGMFAKPPVEPLVETSSDDSPLIIDGTVFPHEASARIRAFSAEERKQWDADRYRCRVDQLALSEVLGLDLTPVPHALLFAKFLKKRAGIPLAELSATKKRMILWSRGHGKSVASRVDIVQTILNYPNVRIAFLTGGDRLAARQLNAIKLVFERPTEKFAYLFPEFVYVSKQNKKGEWKDFQDSMGTQHEFTVPCRTSTIFAEPTFAISTAKSVKAGSHFDLIYVDDLVNDQNYRNEKALETCYENYLDIIPLLDPVGYLIVTGTRYSFGDTYERIQDQAIAAGESSVWSFSIKDCWSAGNCTNCKHTDIFHEDGVTCTFPGCHCQSWVCDNVRGVLFPQVKTRDGRLFGFTLEILNKIKAELGASVFANQYENKPIASESQTFTEEMIRAQTIFDGQQLPRYGAYTFLMGDLAYTEDDARDQSVIFTVLKFQGQLFVVDCAFGHWSSNQLVETTIQLLLTKRPNTLYYEKPSGPADSLSNLIVARAQQVGLQKVPIEWIKVGNQKGTKAIRIGNVQAALMSKRLWLYGGMPGYQQLVDQLVKWPRTKHDDFADCLGRVVEAPTGYQFDKPPEPQTVVNWLHKLHANDINENQEYPDSGAGSGIACC